jgi:hypothetical protein
MGEDQGGRDVPLHPPLAPPIQGGEFKRCIPACFGKHVEIEVALPVRIGSDGLKEGNENYGFSKR